jgi:Fic family protein
MMFLVSEVHPFTDGNGRTARIMMNAELVSGGEERIIIPTVYRSDYLGALKALSLNKFTEPLILALDFAQRWTTAVKWGALDRTTRELESYNAFIKPEEAEQARKYLVMPGAAVAAQ